MKKTPPQRPMPGRPRATWREWAGLLLLALLGACATTRAADDALIQWQLALSAEQMKQSNKRVSRHGNATGSIGLAAANHSIWGMAA